MIGPLFDRESRTQGLQVLSIINEVIVEILE